MGSQSALFLGIDIGTSSAKVVLMDENKQICAQESYAYTYHTEEGGVCEIDPHIWTKAVESCVRRIGEGHDLQSVQSIGVTGQMHTLILLDEAGEPLRPAMMWNDTRTKDLVPDMKQLLAGLDDGGYLQRTISTGSPAVNLYWLRRNEPETLAKASHFLIGPDYIVHYLTGACSTDYCEASTSCLYDMQAGKWSEEVRDFLGLASELYPTLRGSAQCVGTIRSELADSWGLAKETMVTAGTGDNPATAVATGCLGQGYPVLSLGTSGVFMMPMQQFEPSARGKIIRFSFRGNDISYLVQGVVQSNGSTVDWWIKQIMQEGDFSIIEGGKDRLHAYEDTLLFYPHLGGDKTLYADPDLRGAFIGLGKETSRQEMSFAVIEGLCLAFRELAEKMHLPLKSYSSVKVVGGGAGSDLWMQTLADVLDTPVERVKGNTSAAYGAALLAVLAADETIEVSAMTQDIVQAEKIFKPDPAVKDAVERKYRRYRRIHDALQEIDS